MSDELEQQGLEGGEQMELGGEGLQEAPPTPPTPQSVALTPEAIEALVKALPMAPTVPSAPAQQPQLSQEQINHMLAVFSADKRHVERLGIQFQEPTQYDDAVAALNEILDGKTRQAVTMSTLVVENLKRQLMQELQPLQQYVSQAREQALRDAFFAENEDLKPFEPLVEAIYTKLNAAGKHFNSREEAFKTVSDQARQMVAKIQPGQGSGEGATTAPRKMPTVTTGGRGGASATTSGRTVDAVAKSLFGG